MKRILTIIKEVIKKPNNYSAFKIIDIKFFLKFIKPVWKTGALAFFLSIIITAFASLLPLSSKVLIDFVIMKKGFDKVDQFMNLLDLHDLIPGVRHFIESIELIAISILLIGLFIGLIGLVQRYLMTRFQKEITFNVQASLFEHILSFPLSYFRRKETGYLASRVSWDVHSLQYMFSTSATELITKTSLVIFGSIILLALSAKLTLILFCILPLYIFINYFFAKRIRVISESEMEAAAQVSKDIHEVISGVETVKSHTTETKEAEKVSGTMRTAVETGIRSAFISMLSQYSAKGIQLLSIIAILWFGAHEIIDNKMTIGDYVAFTSYMVLLSRAVNVLSTFHLNLQPLYASLDRLMELFRIVPETDKSRRTGLMKPEVIIGEIEFREVCFGYEPDVTVLYNVSFTVAPGEIIALAGPSGAGKTTLINLLLKFHSPMSGQIFLDGNDINQLDTHWLRQHTGIVSQDVFLFKDTIENNIKYGKPFAAKDDVIAAAKKAGIHDVIRQMPKKYETVVGERGSTLSAGQRQRISIARAFLRDPGILIFDEPTSALDKETELLIKDSIKDLLNKRTAFIIAHRESMLDIADKIISLDEGIINEET